MSKYTPALVLILLALTGCTTTWYAKRGQSDEKFYEDTSECEARAGTAVVGLTGWGAYATRSRVYKSCMRGRGWEETP